MNSVNHKQYEECNPIQVSIYNDKIYVWNDGQFPKELASQNLFEKHYSKPYNPLIAQTFFKAGLIESWGRGFEKIKKECELSNTPIPKIDIKENGVMVKCIASSTYMELLGQLQNENVHKNVHKNVYKNSNDELTKIEKQILEIIEKDPKITQSDIASKLKTVSKTIQRGIAKLKEKEIIERIGSNRKGYWAIKK